MSFMYTKELVFTEFKEVTKRDQKGKKETFNHRIDYLKSLKEDMIKNPKTFSSFRVTPQQLQNTIDDWSAPKPIDAFYKRIFGMSFAEKKAQEEIQNAILEKKDKDDKKKEKEKVTIQ